MFTLNGGRYVGAGHPCLVVAECGQNHNGDFELALKMISEAKRFGADCVKFQKSDLTAKFNAKALSRVYDSVNSWGPTYGAHKRFLELTDEQFMHLYDYSKNEGILFTASAMDPKSFEFLSRMDVPFIKIGSGDVDNFPLLEKVSYCGKPLFVSTGMHGTDVVQTVHDLIWPNNRRLCLLHCVSSYPTPYKEVNLSVISDYRTRFPSSVIGYSGHELGTEVSIAAVTLGAKVLERHLTLDKSMKGTDHSCSLEPHEFRLLVNQIRNVEQALSSPKPKCRQPSEWHCYRKLGKSIVAKKLLTKGTALTLNSIDIKVAEPFGIEANKIFEIIGRKVNKDIQSDESIVWDDLYSENTH